MFKLIQRLFDSNEKDLRRLAPVVARIGALEPEMMALSDADLAGKTVEFRARHERGEALDDLLPEAFAVAREASRRVIGKRHFDVQLLGACVLHEGRIAEMKTGEGKTFIAPMAAYLNALEGKGVHIVTVNDYLAKRDSEWMGSFLRFLGLRVGLVIHGKTSAERQEAYRADVTYGTNNEFGFDYLRDNMVLSTSELVQRELHYAIIDEVDSILIDEARTPLIISGAADKPTDLYYRFADIVRRLKPGEDYEVDEKARTVAPTEAGVHRVERILGRPLYDDEGNDLSHYLNQALKAQALFKLDRDYVVKDGEVIIVDEFTGRLMFGRRYSDGLHQAIEAKEGVKIERESQTLATITIQNYFRMYKKLAGMTGTAATEEQEFRKIYKMDVVVIPTNKTMIREDLPDVVYKTEEAKFKAAVEEIAERHATGQPLLVGTISIEKSEELSKMLSRRGIKHQVLNAKYHEKEAEIVAQAGRLGAVTIATNMAGRGTDILLGGNPEFLARQKMRQEGLDPELIAEAAELRAPPVRLIQSVMPVEGEAGQVAEGTGGPGERPEVAAARERYQQLVAEFQRQTDAEHQQVVALGGLHIIGTERHESRRIDNQLRGRAGRQGDPGSSRFYVALEDDLMRLFGGESVASLMDRLGLEDDVPIDHPIISRAIENAQRKVEARNFEARKHVLEYDDVINQQRALIYSERRKLLFGADTRSTVWTMIEEEVGRHLDLFAHASVDPEEWDLAGLLEQAEQAYLPAGRLQLDDIQGVGREALRETLLDAARAAYEEKERALGEGPMRELERLVLLRVIDQKWLDHIDAMDNLREGISLRAYAQRDPLIEYKREAFEMFQAMNDSIREDVVRTIFRVTVVRQPEPRRRMVTSGPSEQPTQKQPVRAAKKVGRNDPCPCGSGKKYKHCHGKIA